jgi:hypothetical protein
MKEVFIVILINCVGIVREMCGKSFILTDKCEFTPDEELERILWFNIYASAFVFNKTLEYSINRENLVKHFGIGKEYKVNRKYTQETVKNLKREPSFPKRCRIHSNASINRPPNTRI